MYKPSSIFSLQKYHSTLLHFHSILRNFLLTLYYSLLSLMGFTNDHTPLFIGKLMIYKLASMFKINFDPRIFIGYKLPFTSLDNKVAKLEFATFQVAYFYTCKLSCCNVSYSFPTRCQLACLFPCKQTISTTHVRVDMSSSWWSSWTLLL